jgi:hypothetical protein
MKLTDLNPHWELDRKYLTFDCPKQHDRHAMRCVISLPIHTGTSADWKIESGDTFTNATISPSIWHHCNEDPHFFIRNGEIVYA